MTDLAAQLQSLASDNPVTFYLVGISVVTFGLFGYDKYKARRGWWRTPEKTLLGFCLAGGTIGGGLGMLTFRHKVSKKSFVLSYWGIVILQAVALTVLFFQKR